MCMLQFAWLHQSLSAQRFARLHGYVKVIICGNFRTYKQQKCSWVQKQRRRKNANKSAFVSLTNRYGFIWNRFQIVFCIADLLRSSRSSFLPTAFFSITCFISSFFNFYSLRKLDMGKNNKIEIRILQIEKSNKIRKFVIFEALKQHAVHCTIDKMSINIF